jgi:hypothetical protein
VLRIESPGVALAAAVTEGGVGGDMLRVRMVDCSAGGAGLQSGVFIPRGCRAHLHVFHPAGAEGEPACQVGAGWLLDVPLRIQRVTMISRDPLYYFGSAFADLTPQGLDGLRRLLASLAAAPTPAADGPEARRPSGPAGAVGGRAC